MLGLLPYLGAKTQYFLEKFHFQIIFDMYIRPYLLKFPGDLSIIFWEQVSYLEIKMEAMKECFVYNNPNLEFGWLVINIQPWSVLNFKLFCDLKMKSEKDKKTQVFEELDEISSFEFIGHMIFGSFIYIRRSTFLQK